MDYTLRRGLVAQTAILNRLVQLGFEVLFPYDNSLGYDLAYFVTEEHRNFGFMISVDIAPKTAMHLRFKSAGRRLGNSRDGFKQRSYEEITDSGIDRCPNSLTNLDTDRFRRPSPFSLPSVPSVF